VVTCRAFIAYHSPIFAKFLGEKSSPFFATSTKSPSASPGAGGLEQVACCLQTRGHLGLKTYWPRGSAYQQFAALDLLDSVKPPKAITAVGPSSTGILGTGDRLVFGILPTCPAR